MDNAKIKRPEKRITFISMELIRVNVDIVALSETRLAVEGSLKEAYYTFLWKGHPPESKKSVYGVAIIIRNSLISQLN